MYLETKSFGYSAHTLGSHLSWHFQVFFGLQCNRRSEVFNKALFNPTYGILRKYLHAAIAFLIGHSIEIMVM